MTASLRAVAVIATDFPARPAKRRKRAIKRRKKQLKRPLGLKEEDYSIGIKARLKRLDFLKGTPKFFTI